jgi:hypothetical protein
MREYSLVINGPKRNCSIVNNFFKHLIANCYIIVLSNEESCDK